MESNWLFLMPNVVATKSSVFWDITPCSPFTVCRLFGGVCCLHLQSWRKSKPSKQPVWSRQQASCWLLAWLILQPWRWRRHLPPKRQHTLNRIHGVIQHIPTDGTIPCLYHTCAFCWERQVQNNGQYIYSLVSTGTNHVLIDTLICINLSVFNRRLVLHDIYSFNLHFITDYCNRTIPRLTTCDSSLLPSRHAKCYLGQVQWHFSDTAWEELTS
jgi:hypothetical protein